MSELTQNFSSNFNQLLTTWINRRVAWLSKHWLALVNTMFGAYVGLPFLAPLLLAHGFTRSANAIYWVYQFLCHLLPSRAYFIEGEQVCLCHRCIAIYGTLFISGLAFNLVRRRVKPLPGRWYLLFMLPMALDGGMDLASEVLQLPFVSMWMLWVIGVVVIGLVAWIVYTQKQLTWPVAAFLACGLLSLAYLQFIGPHQSNFYLRNATGFIYGVGTIWVVYPLLQESFNEVRQETTVRLTIN
jgi:uncharacterized membrane protein